MSTPVYALILPLIVIPVVALMIVIIGSTLLAVGEFMAVPVALAFAFIVLFGAMFLERRGASRQPH